MGDNIFGVKNTCVSYYLKSRTLDSLKGLKHFSSFWCFVGRFFLICLEAASASASASAPASAQHFSTELSLLLGDGPEWLHTWNMSRTLMTNSQSVHRHTTGAAGKANGVMAERWSSIPRSHQRLTVSRSCRHPSTSSLSETTLRINTPAGWWLSKRGKDEKWCCLKRDLCWHPSPTRWNHNQSH